MDKFHKSVNRLVVMSHISKEEQEKFIKKAKKQGFTAIEVPFMVRQLELNNRELMFRGNHSVAYVEGCRYILDIAKN